MTPFQLEISLFGTSIGFMALALLESTRATATRFAGALLVAAIAVTSQSQWIEAIAVFVIATMITELRFLENLAAISWNRSWWVRQATEPERRDDAEKEVAEEMLSVEPARRDALRPEVEKYLAFEAAAIQALRSTGIFVTVSGPSVRITSNRIGTIALDAVAKTPRRHFLVEVKAMQVLRAMQIDSVVGLLERFRIVQPGPLPPRAILIVPAGTKVPPGPEDLFVLEFDSATGSFSDLDSLRKWVGATP